MPQLLILVVNAMRLAVLVSQHRLTYVLAVLLTINSTQQLNYAVYAMQVPIMQQELPQQHVLLVLIIALVLGIPLALAA